MLAFVARKIGGAYDLASVVDGRSETLVASETTRRMQVDHPVVFKEERVTRWDARTHIRIYDQIELRKSGYGAKVVDSVRDTRGTAQGSQVDDFSAAP